MVLRIFDLLKLKNYALPAADGDHPNPPNPDFIIGDVIRVVNSVFADTPKQARLARTGGTDIEENEYVGNVSNFIRILTSKDGDLLSHFDKN